MSITNLQKGEWHHTERADSLASICKNTVHVNLNTCMHRFFCLWKFWKNKISNFRLQIGNLKRWNSGLNKPSNQTKIFS